MKDTMKPNKQPKIQTNWQMSDKDKLGNKSPKDLTMMQVKSLINSTSWAQLCDDRQDVNFVSYKRECYTKSIYRDHIKVYQVEDTVERLGLYRKLTRSFLHRPTPYLVIAVGPYRESHYALVDIGSKGKVNI